MYVSVGDGGSDGKKKSYHTSAGWLTEITQGPAIVKKRNKVYDARVMIITFNQSLERQGNKKKGNKTK